MLCQHELHIKTHKFSLSTNEPSNRFPLPTKGIAGINMAPILISCLPINYLVHNIELGNQRVARGSHATLGRLNNFSNTI